MAGGNSPGVRLEPGPLNALTDVPGVAVGHFTHDRVLRATTPIIAEGRLIAGVSGCGSNPGTIINDALAGTTVGGVVRAIGLTERLMLRRRVPMTR